MHLDVNTLILITTLLCLLLALVMVMLRRSYPPSIKGLGYWAGAIGLSFVGTLMFVTRGKAPDMVSMALAYGVVYWAVALFYQGTAAFLEQPAYTSRWAVGIALAVAELTWFVSVQPDYRLYGISATFFTAVCFVIVSWLLFRHASTQFSTRFTLSVLVAQIATSTGCSLILITQTNPFGTYDPAGVRAMFAAAMSLTIMGVSIGFILMTTQRLRQELEALAAHDSLTGALTRRVMADACEAELERYRRMGHDISLLMMDLDHFKKINDTHGHIAGDQVLIDFVTRAKAALRRVDRLGRFGGEEFILMLPRTSLEGAMMVAERIRASAQQADTPGLPPYTVSIGLTVIRADDATIDVMLKRADAALYQAKALGRNRVEAG